MQMYRVDYSNENLGLDNEFDIIHAESDKEALSEVLNNDTYETIWDIVKIDENYDVIESIW